MGRKDASATRTPVEQYRKQIGKQDYKKSRPVLRATRLKAEAKKTALGIKGISIHTGLQLYQYSCITSGEDALCQWERPLPLALKNTPPPRAV
ncbi:triple QxxK/R motif-containing protein isoform X1 [Eretmochelys imbricata]